jgi:Cu2+-exporting ATPase
MERLAQVDTVVFDKTGTLTEGTPELTNGATISRQDMALAMALAEGSSHPLSRAIWAAGKATGVAPVVLTAQSEVPGYGAEGLLDGQRVRLGRAAWVGADAGEQTSSWLQRGEGPAVAFEFADSLRAGAEEAVSALKASGKNVILMSGDTRLAVEAMAARLGIETWIAEALPRDKAERIAALAAEGHHVLMVGDGLNDTAALTAAHVSISPASALDAARVASDIVLLGGNLAPIAEATETARSAVRRIKENFQIATIYNIIAVPLAVAGMATPLIAALAMSTSSITVSLNALRLRG